MSEILTVTDLKKVYGKGGSLTRALDGVSLSLEAGEFVGVMGPSGSGKTTLLNCVSTIDRPSAGSIVIDGKELTRLKGKELAKFRRERLGFIFQDCNLLDTLTTYENIALSLSIIRAPAQKIDRRVREMADLLGIADCLDKYPYQMSGGQQQRCAAARAMVTHPALVLADEPTGALDSKSS
ncbi:MAG: ABC transporter ATP-binding protein, partial [Lawsonibacter sp.]|nr:ABC transporter ATP-binding protein [Lawsonibacter sp.]